MKSSDFIFDFAHLLYHKYHKIKFRRSGSPLFFRTKNKLESHEKVCGNEDFCKIIMP